MTVSEEIKSKVGAWLVPVGRAYIRYAQTELGKRWVWSKLNWRRYEYITRTKDGALMTGRSDDLVQGYIYYFGVWEPNLTSYIKKALVESDRIFVDVGANVGYFTLLAARLLTNGKVLSFEAFPSIYERLQSNVRLNNLNNVEAFNVAVTDSQKIIEMYHSSCNEGATTCKLNEYSNLPTEFSESPVSVHGDRLDSMIAVEDVAKIRLIKIDVEGAEYEVLKGVFSILPLLPIDAELIVEITPEVLSSAQLSEIFTTMERGGFIAHQLSNKYSPDYYMAGEMIEEIAPLGEIPDGQVDILFSRQINSRTGTPQRNTTLKYQRLSVF